MIMMIKKKKDFPLLEASRGRKQHILSPGNDFFICCRASAQVTVYDNAAVLAAGFRYKGLEIFR